MSDFCEVLRGYARALKGKGGFSWAAKFLSYVYVRDLWFAIEVNGINFKR